MESLSNGQSRRSAAHVGMLNVNSIYPRSPWIPAWWSAAFPGLGYLQLGMYVKGFALIVWELFINFNSKLNLAMLYTFTGRIELAKASLDIRWLLLYIAVYVFCIWDSYRTAVDMNKLAVLARREPIHVAPLQLTSIGIHYLDKRNPLVSVYWSALTPGLGHMYARSIPIGFFLITCWIGLVYYSRMLEALHAMATGTFAQAASSLDPQWFLFMPSLYGFALYDSYMVTVEQNRLFIVEQKQYFDQHYRKVDRVMPIFPKRR